MSLMYLVIASRGPHYEHEEWAEVCSTDHAKLDAWIVEQERKNADELEFQIKLADLNEQFRTENPIPMPTGMSMRDIPRWAPGLGKAQITPKMQEERQALIDNNQLYHATANQLQDDWMQNKWFPAYRQFLLDHGRVVPEPLWLHLTTGHRYVEEVHYRIEEIEQI
jgi:hypothetical protein